MFRLLVSKNSPLTVVKVEFLSSLWPAPCPYGVAAGHHNLGIHTKHNSRWRRHVYRQWIIQHNSISLANSSAHCSHSTSNGGCLIHNRHILHPAPPPAPNPCLSTIHRPILWNPSTFFLRIFSTTCLSVVSYVSSPKVESRNVPEMCLTSLLLKPLTSLCL
jgi:hypothetical protein